jgi:GNAT superfamily N-acetyltransferase
MAVEIEEAASASPEAAAFTEAAWRVFDRQTFGPDYRYTPLHLTARQEGAIVATLRGSLSLGFGYLNELIVADTARGRGIGTALLRAFERRALEAGCRRLALRTIEGGGADDFYIRRGWVVEGRFGDWIGGSTVLQMRRDLP